MNRRILVLKLSLSVVLVALTAPAAHAARVGGWGNTRGGSSALNSGLDFQNIRQDFILAFSGHTRTSTDTLTPAYLSAIDVLLISCVFNDIDVPIVPLSASEQTALTTWVAGGGRALLVLDNSGYYDASRSMAEPFGVQWANQKINGAQSGTIIDHTSFPQITNGPYGVVNTFGGGFISSFANPGPATVLGNWNIGGGAIAAMSYGAGRVVFFGDDAMIADHFLTFQQALRRNTLNYLLTPEPATMTLLLAVTSLAFQRRRIWQMQMLT